MLLHDIQLKSRELTWSLALKLVIIQTRGLICVYNVWTRSSDDLDFTGKLFCLHATVSWRTLTGNLSDTAETSAQRVLGFLQGTDKELIRMIYGLVDTVWTALIDVVFMSHQCPVFCFLFFAQAGSDLFGQFCFCIPANSAPPLLWVFHSHVTMSKQQVCCHSEGKCHINITSAS